MKRQVLVEFVVLVLLLVQSVFLHVFPGQVIHGIAAAVLVVAFVLHTWRVELTPGYILFLLNAGCGLTLRAPPLWLGWVQGVLFIFVIAATFLFPLPLFPPPSPLHPHVGCVSMRLRGVDCRIFYPTNAKDVGKALPYLHHGKHLAIGLHTFIKLPAWFFASLSNGTLWARGDVPLAKATNGWPVMIFSHGMGGSLEMYSSITQYVASEGFVVIVVNHDDGSASVSRNVDEITYSYYQRPPQSALDDWVGEGYFIRNKQVHARVRHVRAVLDALVDLQTDEGGLFYEGLNLDHVAAAATDRQDRAKRDSRIKVVVGLDMWLEPIDADVVAEGVPDVAVCSIISQHWMDEWDSHFEQLKTMARRCRHPSSAFFALAQTRHNNFCDLALFSPVQLSSMKRVNLMEVALANGDVSITQVEVVQEKVHEYDESAASDDLYEKKLLKLRNLQRQAMESSDAISRIRRSMVAKEKTLKEHEPAVEVRSRESTTAMSHCYTVAGVEGSGGRESKDRTDAQANSSSYMDHMGQFDLDDDDEENMDLELDDGDFVDEFAYDRKKNGRRGYFPSKEEMEDQIRRQVEAHLMDARDDMQGKVQWTPEGAATASMVCLPYTSICDFNIVAGIIYTALISLLVSVFNQSKGSRKKSKKK
ncbi:hypothetical protein DYB32_007922 [Aphanomyces invadans]|uniref:1-alkyl-2-acetylglycerophosphocholine esterase n=1 Tax=Aphanomyces invadans TaxID=157072 RepID=A0A418AML5_9STRA|nr:hypothetical protein DYB32_007922 [Aphanomyces invadans]